MSATLIAYDATSPSLLGARYELCSVGVRFLRRGRTDLTAILPPAQAFLRFRMLSKRRTVKSVVFHRRFMWRRRDQGMATPLRTAWRHHHRLLHGL